MSLLDVFKRKRFGRTTKVMEARLSAYVTIRVEPGAALTNIRPAGAGKVKADIEAFPGADLTWPLSGIEVIP